MDVIKELKRDVSNKSKFDMVVRRSNVLTDALRRMERARFDPQNELNVCQFSINCIHYMHGLSLSLYICTYIVGHLCWRRGIRYWRTNKRVFQANLVLNKVEIHGINRLLST